MIHNILKKIDQIPLLPQNIHQLMAIVNDPKSSAAELVKIVEQDPALVMQSLHLCNSAFYSLPIEVTSISHAVRYLGMDTVAGLAMAAYFQSLLPARENRTINPWVRGLKDHLLATAQLSEMLAKNTNGKIPPSTLFTAGLLHDIGKLVFSKLENRVAQEVYQRAEAENLSLNLAEQEVLGTDHTAVGWQLAIRWRLPDVLMDAIRYHHDPFSSEYVQTFYVYMANRMANAAKNDPLLLDLFKQPEFLSVIEEVGSTSDQLLKVMSEWTVQRTGGE